MSGGRPRRPETAWLTDVGGVWYITWRDDATGRDRRRSTRTRRREEAEVELARWLLARSAPIQAEPDAVRLGQVLAAYLDYIAPRASAEQAIIAVEWISKSAIGGALVSELDLPAQERFVAWLGEHGHSAGYISRTLSVLRAALNRAYRTHMLKAPSPYIMDVERPEPRQRVLTPDELARWYAACDEPHLRMAIALLINTGARPGAVLGLDWTRVDLVAGLINFRLPSRSLTKKRAAIVTINDVLRAVLEAVPVEERHGPVVKYKGSSEPIKRITKGMRAARLRAGLDAAVVTYTLRHTAASAAMGAGASAWSVAGMLGHSSVRMVEQRYGHHAPEYLAQATAALGNRFSASFPPGKAPNGNVLAFSKKSDK